MLCYISLTLLQFLLCNKNIISNSQQNNLTENMKTIIILYCISFYLNYWVCINDYKTWIMSVDECHYDTRHCTCPQGLFSASRERKRSYPGCSGGMGQGHSAHPRCPRPECCMFCGQPVIEPRWREAGLLKPVREDRSPLLREYSRRGEKDLCSTHCIEVTATER